MSHSPGRHQVCKTAFLNIPNPATYCWGLDLTHPENAGLRKAVIKTFFYIIAQVLDSYSHKQTISRREKNNKMQDVNGAPLLSSVLQIHISGSDKESNALLETH